MKSPDASAANRRFLALHAACRHNGIHISHGADPNSGKSKPKVSNVEERESNREKEEPIQKNKSSGSPKPPHRRLPFRDPQPILHPKQAKRTNSNPNSQRSKLYQNQT